MILMAVAQACSMGLQVGHSYRELFAGLILPDPNRYRAVRGVVVSPSHAPAADHFATLAHARTGGGPGFDLAAFGMCFHARHFTCEKLVGKDGVSSLRRQVARRAPLIIVGFQVFDLDVFRPYKGLSCH